MRIEQTGFSSFVSDFLAKEHPQFIDTLKQRDDGSFDCIWRSPNDTFAIWIATYDKEITIGLEDPEGDTNIHTHISCYEEDAVQMALNQLSKIVRSICDNKLLLFKSSISGYQWSDDISKTVASKKRDETVTILYWNNKQKA